MIGSGLLRDLRRTAGWHRRLLAAALAAAAVAFGLEAMEPPAAPHVRVLAADTDLTGGATLSTDDVRVAMLPPEAVPAGVLSAGTDVTGRVLAAPVRAGEPLTDVRLVGPALVEGYGAGLVAAPVRIADPAAVRLLRPGDIVDVLAASVAAGAAAPASAAATRTAPAVTVAAAVPVVAVPEPGEDGLLAEGALVVLATTPTVAEDLAGAAVTSRLSLVVRAARAEPATPS